VIKVSGHNELRGQYAAHTVNLHQADGNIATISGDDISSHCIQYGKKVFGDGQLFEFNVPPGASLHEIDTDCHGKITGIKTAANDT
jgi:hypothetical protein